MWCALLPSSRPDSTVVVCAGRNWAALGSPFFYLCCIFARILNVEMLKNLGYRDTALTFTR